MNLITGLLTRTQMLKSHVEDGNMLITRLTASLIAALTYKQNCVGREDYSVVQFIV